uniref:Uncharacterized protein n=1 Tax=Cacopsylla melanoneura TaxID=428564 RepID=A0A8D8WGT7_9HEMI
MEVIQDLHTILNSRTHPQHSAQDSGYLITMRRNTTTDSTKAKEVIQSHRLLLVDHTAVQTASQALVPNSRLLKNTIKRVIVAPATLVRMEGSLLPTNLRMGEDFLNSNPLQQRILLLIPLAPTGDQVLLVLTVRVPVPSRQVLTGDQVPNFLKTHHNSQ